MAGGVVGVHDSFLGDTPLVEDSGALIGGSSIRDDWDGRLTRRDLPIAAGNVEVFRCWHYHSEMTMLASTEWRGDLTEVAIEAIPCLDVVLIGLITDAAWKPA